MLHFGNTTMLARRIEDIVEWTEDTKGIPESPISLRTVAVPGTGTDDVANNSVAGNWWILKVIPL
jgi:hypothetical protein